MKVSSLLPGLLTPAAVAPDLTCHCKAVQSWRLVTSLLGSGKNPTSQPRAHLTQCASLVSSPSLLQDPYHESTTDAVSGEIREGYSHVLPVPPVSYKSGNGA